MKKVLTILVVLALVCGAVFAAETHSVTLKTLVGEIIPAFQLHEYSLVGNRDANGDGTADNDVEVGSQKTNASAATYTNTGYDFADDVFVGDLSKYDVTVVFQAKLANKAKTVTDYKLTFEAGAFKVSRDGVGLGVNDTPEYLPVASQKVVTDSVGAHDGVTAGKTAVTTSIDPDNALVVKVDFNGSECVANTDLAQFEVKYTHDTTIDPTTTGYFADIKMTVTVW